MDHKTVYLDVEEMITKTKEEHHVENAGTDDLSIIDAGKEKQVLRKQDFLIIPLLFAMFFLGYLVGVMGYSHDSTWLTTFV